LRITVAAADSYGSAMRIVVLRRASWFHLILEGKGRRLAVLEIRSDGGDGDARFVADVFGDR
jgi:hypothetical protein